MPIRLDEPESLLFLDRAYRAVLDRPPDAAGLAGYGHLLACGVDRSAIVEMLVASQEFISVAAEDDFMDRARTSVLRLEAEARLASLAVVRGDVLPIVAAYAVVLGREPDGPGFLGHYRYLRSGGSLRRAVRWMRSGPEGVEHAGGRPSRRIGGSRSLLDSVERTTNLYALAFAAVVPPASTPNGPRSIRLAPGAV